MDWFLAEGYPANMEAMWTNPGGIVDQTNQIFADAGAKVRMRVWRYDDMTDGCAGGSCTFGNDANPVPKQFGDVRYNFVHWVSDLDVENGAGFAGFTPSLNDPRTGERISTVINIQDWPLDDYYETMLDYYLQTIGADPALTNGEWPTVSASCVVGDTFALGGLTDVPVNPLTAAQQQYIMTYHNQISTVFDKMQLYMHKDAETYGYLNPADFVPQESSDFFGAMFKLLPYEVFRDPATNPFVIPEGGAGYYAPEGMTMDDYATRAQWHAMMSAIDHGYTPYESVPTLGYAAPANSYDGTGGPGDVAALSQFNANLHSLRQSVFNQQYKAALGPYGRNLDNTDILNNFSVFAKDARHCVWNNAQHTSGPAPACAGGGSGTTHWECRSEYLNSLVQSYWTQTVWHEFGHAVGLRHNFMSSLDRNNFPTWTDLHGNTHIGLYASSLMEYNSTPDRIFFAGGAGQDNGNGGPWANGGVSQSSAANAGNAPTHNVNWNGLPGWAPYDIGAVSFIYGNNRVEYTNGNNCNGVVCQLSVGTAGKTVMGPVVAPQNVAVVSGQTSKTTPWNDPNGWNPQSNQEIQYLFCTDEHLQYSPFCRTGDFGTTPSEIVASAIDTYEWMYKWRNFRLYHKFWNDGPYADGVNGFFMDITRFLSTWAYDWSVGELASDFPKVGVVAPPAAPLGVYYIDLAEAFSNDISKANQLVATFHKAIVQQSSGERPYVTLYDSFYGDVTQQGIIIDKLLAIQNWMAMYEINNYDPVQAAGAYMFSDAAFGDPTYAAVAEDALLSTLGGEYGLAFPYVSPMSVGMFAEASHDINFPGYWYTRDWIGGFVFGGPELDPNQSFLDYFHTIAQNSNATQVDPVEFAGCVLGQPLNNCMWDPRIPNVNDNDQYHSDDYNEFRGPDGRRYSWAWIADRNQIVVVDRDRNVASYVTLRNYNTDIVATHDDGSSGAYGLQLPIKYTMGYFQYYN